jgi:hypothetical protein
MMHAPLVGPYLLGRRNALARRGVYLSVVDRDKFRREALSAYEMVLSDPERRLLTWTWPRWIPLDEDARALNHHRAGSNSPRLIAQQKPRPTSNVPFDDSVCVRWRRQPAPATGANANRQYRRG